MSNADGNPRVFSYQIGLDENDEDDHSVDGDEKLIEGLIDYNRYVEFFGSVGDFKVIDILDRTPPIITVLGDNPQTLELGSEYLELNASTDDNSSIMIDSSDVDMNSIGEYNVTYNSRDASNNEAITVYRIVIVEQIAKDSDNDGIIDSLDNCPLTINVNQLNTDNDAQGNACDTDDDNDGVEDNQDAFPLNTTESLDTDNDGIGNNSDTDDDNDGVLDHNDDLPLNRNEFIDTDGDGIGNNADSDDDNDGISDSNERRWGFDPLDASDGNNADADNDGVSNKDEIKAGSNPLNPQDKKKPKKFAPISIDGLIIIVPIKP
jgi:hypothetical protein